MTGNIWKYSFDLDAEDLEFGKREFITIKMGQEYYGLTEKMMNKLAWESGAVFKFNKDVRIKREILEAHMREIYRKDGTKHGKKKFYTRAQG